MLSLSLSAVYQRNYVVANYIMQLSHKSYKSPNAESADKALTHTGR